MNIGPENFPWFAVVIVILWLATVICKLLLWHHNRKYGCKHEFQGNTLPINDCEMSWWINNAFIKSPIS